jgi:predicted ester cyclase
MSKQEQNKAVVGRWFTEFWGKNVNLGVVDEIAAPDMLLKYSLHEPRRGRDDIKAFMTDFRAAFPDLNFWGTADLIAEGDYVVGQWEGGGVHTGPAFSDFLAGGLPAATGRRMHFTGTTVLKVINGKIVEGDRARRWRNRTDATWIDQNGVITQATAAPEYGGGPPFDSVPIPAWTYESWAYEWFLNLKARIGWRDTRFRATMKLET